LVLYGDVPLIQADTLKRLLHAARDALAILTVDLAQPGGYGRIVRSAAGEVLRIVEEKDATPAEKAIHEVNTGIIALPTVRLAEWLASLSNDNAQQEYYLTDIVGMAVAAGVPIRTRRHSLNGKSLASIARCTWRNSNALRSGGSPIICWNREYAWPTRRASTCVANSSAVATCSST
jgi:bifunctional N-acetylglucosamine-1-phosphate-uridyltransferase/glucosamine-1-phosphate-acetyltransferase GlmU-like protein